MNNTHTWILNKDEGVPIIIRDFGFGLGHATQR